MKALLIGGFGQLGTAIRHRWTDVEIVAPKRAELDIESDADVQAALDRARPDLVVNCASFHDVDRCEIEPRRAFAVNAFAVDALARRCRAIDVTFVTISTDYVFDGRAARPYREGDEEHPLSAYGVSKLAGEILALRLDMRAFVVRTCGLYGIAERLAKSSFIDRVIGRGASGEPVVVTNDVTASPTFAGHLAIALRRLIDTERYGLYHAANEGPVTWFDFAAEAMKQAAVSTAPVPRRSEARPDAAERPAYSALDCTKLASLGIQLPNWRIGICDYLIERNGRVR